MAEAMLMRWAKPCSSCERARPQKSKAAQIECALHDAVLRGQYERCARSRTEDGHGVTRSGTSTCAPPDLESYRDTVQRSRAHGKARAQADCAGAEGAGSTQREAELCALRKDAKQKATEAKRKAQAELAYCEAVLKAEAKREHNKPKCSHQQVEHKVDEAWRMAELERAYQEAMMMPELTEEWLRQELKQRAEEVRREAELWFTRKIEAVKAVVAQHEAGDSRVGRDFEGKTAKAAHEAKLKHAG
ncbi:hypothetical protein PsYK624_165960 [Phanerochaete sordida]|uniref:Uncharacterized protein n=1 Tax=Phanerochaete sordida TaxID=48140 RepID=A0A9P3GR56_9APHY|nr:hypothetical protein PsYK624_165960 [Phanerochaete sordida]